MCLGSKPKPQAVAPIPRAPSRDTAAEAATSERRRLRTSQGVYGNVFTSVLGDPTYNSSATRQNQVASLGA